MSRAFRVGLLIVVTLLILATGIFLIGDKDLLFSATYRLDATFQNVAGLNNGADVRVGGIHVGTVKQIDLPERPDGKVTVVMKVKDSTRNLIRKDSVASIKTEGLLGNKYVEVSFGSNQAANVQDGDAIRSEAPTDIADVSKDVAAQAKAAVSSFQDNMEALKHNFVLRGFFTNRGYDDASELTKNAISRLPGEPPSKEFDYDAKRIFGKPGSAKLQNQQEFKEAGEFLAENTFRLAVVATNETRGDTAKDQVLTQARAKVVRDYLTQNFRLDDTRLRTIGLGKSKQTADQSRVQILIYGVQPAVRTSQNQSAN
jgi:outer membrane protein OmpA-like peptidoglycan-associated protein